MTIKIDIGASFPHMAIRTLVGSAIEIVWRDEVVRGKITELQTGETGSLLIVEENEKLGDSTGKGFSEEWHTRPAEAHPTPEPIPAGHYFDDVENLFVRKNNTNSFFYYTDEAFRKKWYARRAEFPLYLEHIYGPPSKGKPTCDPFANTEFEFVVGEDLNFPPPKLERKQVDGNHYDTMAMDPVSFCDLNKHNPYQFSMIKHASRYPNKGEAVIDLKKVIDYAQLALLRQYGVESKIVYGDESNGEAKV
jgi:hypothetical protein